MKTKICLITLLAAVLFVGCKSDDDEPTPSKPTETTHRVQIMTVFAPGQLGDLGYADRVMKGVSTLKKSDSDDVEVSIISADNVLTTRQMLTNWANTLSSSVDGATYSRRLLVLTEPYMVEWVADVKTKLNATDEVLLLKANEADVQAAAQTLNMGDRVHGLNISAASAVKHFDEARRQYCEWTSLNTDTVEIGLVRLYDEGVVAYRDSIGETLKELAPSHDPYMFSIIDKAGEQYSTRYEVTAFEAAYHVCGLCYAMAIQRADSIASESAFKTFVISDLGSANNGAEMFLVSKNQRIAVIMLMLDAESNTDMIRFSVIRHFDRALANWAQQWLNAPEGSMPKMEMHGSWDGYCTDDIDVNLLKGI